MAIVADDSHETLRSARLLLLLGILSGCGYGILSWLSRYFVAEVPDSEKPTIWMLLIFVLEFFCYWSALRFVIRLQPTRMLLCGIAGGACLFRAILLPSVPMHEIDIYRYIWDGAVVAEGIDPYRYSPQQVQEAAQRPTEFHEEGLQSLVRLQASSKSLAYSLHQIHYGELSSPYPLVSQAIFAWAALVTPADVTPQARLVVMKLQLVLFDLATLLVVIALLRTSGLHPGLSIAYGWCPLVMKEIANGGHLDSIAIFFATLAIWLLVRCGSRKAGSKISVGALSGVVLALAIAAKIYPVVLLPLFVAVWWRQCGFTTVCSGVLATVLPTVLLLAPMFALAAHDPPASIELVPSDAPPAVNVPILESNTPRAAGLQAFFKRWEMNDLLFMVVLENLRAQADVAPEVRPWFVVVPDAWSKAVVSHSISLGYWMKSLFVRGAPPPEVETQSFASASFLLTRVITGAIFGFLACWLAWRAAAVCDPHVWCRAAMLTLAWFWLTSPTQNPWYWCWVLPLLPFAKCRTWYFVAACTLLYYLRFWLSAHYPGPPTLGTRYDGEYFFYFVVVWFEFAPVLLLLGLEWFVSWRKSSGLAIQTQNSAANPLV